MMAAQIKTYEFIKPYTAKVLVSGGIAQGKEVYADYIYKISDTINGWYSNKGVQVKAGIDYITIPMQYLQEVHNSNYYPEQDRRGEAIKKYKITKDFNALYKFTDYGFHTAQARPPKKFYKGDIVDAIIFENRIVSNNYDITEVAELYTENNNDNQDNNSKQYEFVKDYTSYYHNSSTNKQDIIKFVKGDIYYGIEKDGEPYNFVEIALPKGNKMEDGMIGGSSMRVPISYLKEVNSDKKTESKKSKIFTKPNIIIGSAVIIVIIGYVAFKKGWI